MLHIIFLILKIIVFLILGIIALILLLAAVILLSPLVYRLDLSADDGVESINGRVRFHWLMHLVAGEAVYQNGSFTWHFRAAWKNFGSEEDDTFLPDNDKADDRDIPERDATANIEKRSAEVQVKPDPEISGKIQTETPDDETDKVHDKAHKAPEKPQKDIQRKKKEPEQKNKVQNLYERFLKFLDKIKYTFQKICDKIKTLRKKKDRIAAFLKNETHQNAFYRALRELKRLFTFLRPSKASVDLEFGFADPALTGYTLAGISMIYPMIGEFTQIKPDFEHKMFRCSGFVKGKIRLVYGLIIALNMLLDKNVRVTYHHIRKFRL